MENIANLKQLLMGLSEEKIDILIFYAKFLKSRQDNQKQELSTEYCQEIRDLVKYVEDVK